jgi:PAS domain-containing protein
MAGRNADRTSERSPDEPAGLLEAGLDALSFGFAIFDKDLKLVTSNQTFRKLRGYPAALCRPGTDIIELYRFNAERGDYGAGDAEAQAKSRLERVRERRRHALEYELATGRILNIQYTPISHNGLLMSYADITERKRTEEEVANKEAQLRIAMDNMPGALVYTNEELNVVVHNPVPKELLQPGRPYTDFLRYLAEHGYYGEGDVEVLVAERVESLRNPSDKTFEDHTPDGRVHRIGRRRVAGGGTVTVITDITELKRTEEEVANKEAQLRIAMDNMPGALVYTNEELNVVVHNTWSSLTGASPRSTRPRRSCSSLDVRIRIFFAIWPSMDTTGRATSMHLSPSGWSLCITPQTRLLRTTRRMAVSMRFIAVERWEAVR